MTRLLSIRAWLILLVLAIVLPAAGLLAWMSASARSDAGEIAIIGLLALLPALVLAHRISAVIVGPVRRLAATAARIADGDLGARAALAGPAEVEFVARQFNRMLDVRADAEEALRSSEARFDALANYDALTSLPNRVLFQQRLQRSLVHAQRFDGQLAVLFIDLDRFKNVNDTLGHDAGDRVLQAMAGRLKGCLREVDTLARLGGDEFGVLIEQVSDTRFVGSVARKLLQAMADLLRVDGQEYHLSASIGISTYPADGGDATVLLKNADIAMYRAKDRGKNNSQFYAAAMNAHSMQRLSLETGLRHALERGEFLLHYQPKVDIASGRITGMEALVRWVRPEGGMVSPAEFIPLAEETGLIAPIGAWVLKAACERNRAWQRQGMPALRVAVNLSARQFRQANLVSEVARVLDASGLAPGSLELEITESMVMDNPERAIQTLCQLKSMGIALAIDDFGTGYSSLGYLKRFPIDNIKIDRSFIKDIPRSNDDAIITRTIIDMTHNLRLKVVAEGVETQAQMDFLRAHGCDEIQGYYFSRPLAEDAFLALLRSQEGNAAIAA